jgi:CheY-like chemotaxis protein
MDTCTGGKIVIIDDMQIVLILLNDILEEAGITNVVPFTDPLKAIEAMQCSGQPSLIITDYNMPEMNGIQLLTEISKTFPNIPGIIISSETEKLIGGPEPYHVMSKHLMQTEFFIELVKRLSKCS